MAKKMTADEKEAQQKKLLSRYGARVRELTKQIESRYVSRGWNIDISKIKALNVPKEKVTEKHIEKIKALKPKELITKHGKYGGELSYGEIVSASKGLKLERQEASRKRKETIKQKRQAQEEQPYDTEEIGTPSGVHQNMFYNFIASLEHFPKVAKPYIESWIGTMVDQAGSRDAVITAIGEAMENGDLPELTYEWAYDESAIANYMNAVMDYMGFSNYAKDIVTDYMEQEGSALDDYSDLDLKSWVSDDNQ